MVLWSVGFLLVAIYYLDIAIYDWRESKSFWNGFWVVIFFHAVVVSLKDIYLGKAPELVLLFVWGFRMNIFKTNDKDSIYWLKVVMRQAQHDIKELKEEVRVLKEINQTKDSKSKYYPENLKTIKIRIGEY